MQYPIYQHRLLPEELKVPFLLAFLQLIFLMIFHGNYNYFRDELYYIACSDHLAFGYVDQPPLSIFLLKMSRLLLGDSLYAIRFLPAFALSIVVILAAMIARRIGGGKPSMIFASLCVVAAPGLIGHGKYFTMNPFDVLFWSLAIYVVVVILKSDRPKLWVIFGIIVGLGLMNKYSIGFMSIGIVAGLLLTKHRKHLGSKWFWIGILVAFLIVLPHILWEIQNNYPSLEFMRNASHDKNVHLSVFEFFMGQVRDLNIFNAPIWLTGLYFFFFNSEGKRFRPLGWMFIVVFILMVAGNAKVYYLSPIFPVMLAGGSVFVEHIVSNNRWRWVKPVYASLVILMGLIALPFAVPVLPVDTFIQYEHALGMTPHQDERASLGDLPQYYADQFGWEEFVGLIAKAYSTLTPEEKAKCLIFVRNYGEAGAVDFYGKKYGLPPASCAHNNYWLWGPGKQTGDIAIIVGGSRTLDENYTDLNRPYEEVKLAGTTFNKYAMPFENGRFIFICKGMRTTFQAIWEDERFYF